MKALYNGWTNRATWLVKLWLDNDEYSQREMERICRAARSTYAAADELREFVESLVDDTSGFTLDLLTFALDSVNWEEIAQAVKDDQEDE